MDKNQYFERYTNRTHLFGRIGTSIGIIMMMAAPVVMGLALGEAPDMAGFWGAFLGSGLTWSLISIAEFLIYTPMLGAGGGYLAFLTGNLINMKIPCMMNARSITGAETGTPENEIASTLSIAASAVTTTAVIALGAIVLRMVAVSEPFFGVSIVLEGMMQGVGSTVVPFVSSIAGMWGVRILGTFLCTQLGDMGLISAWACMITHNLFLCLMLLLYYLRGKWNPLSRRQEQ